jgi:hypothetical protein
LDLLLPSSLAISLPQLLSAATASLWLCYQSGIPRRTETIFHDPKSQSTQYRLHEYLQLELHAHE